MMTSYAVTLTPRGWQVTIDGEPCDLTFASQVRAERYIADRALATGAESALPVYIS